MDLSVQRILPGGAPAGVAGVVDVETTGLDPWRDEVVELAVILFRFEGESGRIAEVVDEYTGLREPGRPIHPAAARVHGLTLEILRGRRVDSRRVEAMIERAEFLIAHNAAFDRPFVGRLFPGALSKPWLCSMNDIDWHRYGFPSRGLQELLHAHGIRVDQAHRGPADARATLSLLACTSPSGKTYFSQLLRNGLRRLERRRSSEGLC